MNQKRTYKRQALTSLFMLTGILIAINVLSSSFFSRIDLTADKRFTLTDSTKKLLKDLKDVVFVRVYLEGDFPSGFKRLATATKEMLDEFKVYGGDKIQYEFINPTEGKSEKELKDVLKELTEKGLEPTNVKNRAGDEYSEQVVVPGALVNYKGGKEAPVNLLESTPGSGAQNSLNNSMAHLEYNFSKAIRQLTFIAPPKIGILQGHGELEGYQMPELLNELSSYYDVQFLDPGTTVSIPGNIKVLIVAKPTLPFSDKDKFKIDQYLMNGGSILWMIEALNAELDSVLLRRSYMTFDYPLNLEDQLFRYGIRVNPDLLLDLQCNPVPLLVSTEGQQPDFKLFPCFYFPVLAPAGNHEIVKDVDAVQSKFASSIDTLVLKDVRKTILLQSSTHSRLVFTPWLINFNDLRNRPNVSDYNKQAQIAAVLLEGKFPSVFKNRVTPEMESVLRDSLHEVYQDESVPAKMIVVGDGDITANEFNAQGQPYPLGYYHYTGQYFGNKNFMLNCIDYLAGYPQLLDTRSKTLKLRLLDETKVKETKLKWQLVNMLAPLGLLLLFAFLFNFIRIQRFAR